MMQPVKSATFCAHDENTTTLQYVPQFKRWVVIDKRGLSIEFERFADAMINMTIITGVTFTDWTILGEM